jgi:hypothetical protein
MAVSDPPITALDHLRKLVEFNLDEHIMAFGWPEMVAACVAAREFVEDIDRKAAQQHEQARAGYLQNRELDERLSRDTADMPPVASHRGFPTTHLMGSQGTPA